MTTLRPRPQFKWKWLYDFLWMLVMIGLPLTSFPLIARLTGSTVAPFSALPLALLGLTWFFPYLLRLGELPKETKPFIIFTGYVIVLAAYAFYRDVDAFRDQSQIRQLIRAFAPFIIGLAVFLITSAWHKNSQMLKRSLQWIHVGGILMMAYSTAQAVVMLKLGDQYPPFLAAIKDALVTQSLLTGSGRIGGLTWEASWLADQFVMLYLPLWLAATFQGTSVFPKLWKLSVENILLVVGIVLFYLTSPRIGGAAFLLMVSYLFLRVNVAVYRWIIRKVSGIWQSMAHPRLLRAGIGALVAIGFISVYALMTVGAFRILSQRDWRLNLISNFSLSSDEGQRLTKFNEDSLFYAGYRFAFLERTVYWMDGWHIFNDFPMFGVGLGNAGYYFFPRIPSIGWATVEIRAVVYRNAGLPNIKSMWYRLLAETGIVGFTIFIVWLLGLWLSARSSLNSRDGTMKTIALAGQLALIAFIFEGLSIDSFGFPYLFLIAGLIASTGWISRHQARSAASSEEFGGE